MTLAVGSLAHLGILALRGADSLGFLQGQITNDARRLDASECILTALCTPQGRVIAAPRVLRAGDDILLLLPRELVAGVRDGLRRYVLRAKVTLTDRSEELRVAGLLDVQQLPQAGLTPPATGRADEQQGVCLASVPGDPARLWLIGEEKSLDEHLPGWRDADDFEPRWKLADVRAGLPQVYAATSEAFVPQMLDLDLLDGIRFDKGCYTGQEIVARTQHRGRIKRRLFRVDLPAGEHRVGDTLRLEDGRSGRLVEYAAADGARQGLAVFSVDPGAEAGEDGLRLPTSAVHPAAPSATAPNSSASPA